MKRWLTVEQLMELVPLSRDTIYREILAGKLSASQIRGRYLIREDDAERWLDEHRTSGAPRLARVPRAAGSLRALNESLGKECIR